MEIKHKKPLIVAALIDIFLGVFLIICGMLEFLGWDTQANTSLTTAGVQLSYLVFISGLLVFFSGGLTFLKRHTLDMINLQIFIGVIALAWPIFVSISLFFSRLYICIRLLPTMLSALFYIIAILIVKITNESLRKTHKINTKIGTTGKRKQSINVSAILSNASETAKSSKNISALGDIASMFKKKNATAVMSKTLQSGKRHSSINPFAGIYSGRRRSGGGLFKWIYSGGRIRRHRRRRR